ncbi:hypothetical protein [Serratia liquefaciens]|uniref:hypothetical protein n=1 Tax=Serratia liquefaciens TaxID=614 RepID=UPI003EC581AE
MSFKLKSVKTVQIYYHDSYLCDKDIELEMVYSVDSVYQDDSGNTKAKLYVQADDTYKIYCGDYLVTIDPNSETMWAVQAESQLMAMAEFAGATI